MIAHSLQIGLEQTISCFFVCLSFGVVSHRFQHVFGAILAVG